MLIKSKGPEKWLTDPRQQDDKRPDHPAREFGHEPIVKGSFPLWTVRETDEQVLMRLSEGLYSVGSLKGSTFGGRTVQVEMVSYEVPRFRWIVREKGEVIEEGILA